MKIRDQYFLFNHPSLLSTACLLVGIFIMTLSVSRLSHAQATIASQQIREIAWSPKGDKVAFSYENGQITIASLNRGETSLNLRGHTGPVFTLAWSPNGDFLASGGANPDNTLRIWDVVNGQEVFTQPGVGADILAVAWSPDGNQVLAVAAEPFNDPSNAVIVEPASGQVTTLRLATISDIAWSSDSTKVAMSGIGSVYIYDASNFQRLSEFQISQDRFREGLQNQPVTVTWNPDGTHIAIGMGDGRVFLWELDNPEPIATLIGNDYQGNDRFQGWIYDLHFDSTGQMLTSVSGDGTIRTWELQNGTLLAEQITTPNYAANFSPYGARIALGLTPEAISETATTQSNTVDVVQTLANGAVQIVVPVPSLERLQAIADACNAPSEVKQTLASAQSDQLTNFTAQVEALPEGTIPPACAADLLAVAQALQSQ